MLKGWRTVAVNAAILAGTGALQQLANFDWVAQVGSFGSMAIVTLINLGLRAITTTKLGVAGPTN